eukprot:SAG11_NODE_1038_length_6076_cov_4.857454_6_plen_103_part_00
MYEHVLHCEKSASTWAAVVGKAPTNSCPLRPTLAHDAGFNQRGAEGPASFDDALTGRRHRVDVALRTTAWRRGDGAESVRWRNIDARRDFQKRQHPRWRQIL